MTDTLRAALYGGLIGGLSPILFTFAVKLVHTQSMLRFRRFSRTYAKNMAECFELVGHLPSFLNLPMFRRRLDYARRVVTEVKALDVFGPRAVHRDVSEASFEFAILVAKCEQLASEAEGLTEAGVWRLQVELQHLQTQAKDRAKALRVSFKTG